MYLPCGAAMKGVFRGVWQLSSPQASIEALEMALAFSELLSTSCRCLLRGVKLEVELTAFVGEADRDVLDNGADEGGVGGKTGEVEGVLGGGVVCKVVVIEPEEVVELPGLLLLLLF